MKRTLAIASLLALAACGQKPNLAPAAQAAAPAVVKVAAEPETFDADKALAQRVMRAIDEAKIRGIDAVSVDGVVTLWGATTSAGERRRAGDIAAGVEGVKAVDNRLEVVIGS